MAPHHLGRTGHAFHNGSRGRSLPTTRRTPSRHAEINRRKDPLMTLGNPGPHSLTLHRDQHQPQDRHVQGGDRTSLILRRDQLRTGGVLERLPVSGIPLRPRRGSRPIRTVTPPPQPPPLIPTMVPRGSLSGCSSSCWTMERRSAPSLPSSPPLQTRRPRW